VTRPRVNPIWTALVAALVALIVILAIGETRLRPAADPLPAGFGCVKTDKPNGGFTLDCDPASSPAPSPSVSPTVIPSPTPSMSPTASQPPTPSPTVTQTTPPPTTPPPPPPPPGCPVAGANVPGAADPWGGCWPGPGLVGVPVGTTLTAYTGPCTITVANTVIDAKTVNCDLVIRAANVGIRNTRVNGMVTNSGIAGSSFTIVDSTVSNPARDGGCQCVGDHDYTALRVEVIGGLRGGWCASHCTIQDSWSHGRLLGYFNGSGQSCAPANAKTVPSGCVANHGSGWREEQFGSFTHNVLSCDFLIANDTTSLGCSADLTGYADFAPIHDNNVTRNLFTSSGPVLHADTGQTGPTPVSFCIYGGASPKPFSGDPSNATNQVFTQNVWQRGLSNKCGDFGPVTDFNTAKAGNVWSGNMWTDGATVPPG
jgi:hypothetical protein